MNDKRWFFLFFAWVLAMLSTLGSLFFSEVMMLPPCILCWYQRIAMYPLVLVFFMGFFPFDPRVVRFSLPLVLVGWGIAVYHNLLYYKIIPESVSPCVRGISCTTVQIEWLGFITIPFMSLTAFTLILGLLLMIKKDSKNEK